MNLKGFMGLKLLFITLAPYSSDNNINCMNDILLMKKRLIPSVALFTSRYKMVYPVTGANNEQSFSNRKQK